MSDWEEVRKLAADFQQLQATAGANRLSERNCIELVTRLIQMGQIDVVYTVDGKEYVTPQHLEKEIKNELLVHRGRQIVIKAGNTGGLPHNRKFEIIYEHLTISPVAAW